MPDSSAKDVVNMLRRHYLPENRPAGGVLAVEIGSPDGGRRADALWAPLTYTGGEGLTGHEVKISRADVMAELADPTKSQAWAQYCTRWYLTVSTPALIDGLEIPDQWGIMAPPSGRRTRTMTILRKAPQLKPGDTSAAWRRVMAWRYHHDREDLLAAKREAESYARTVESLRSQINDAETRAWAREDRNALQVREILSGIEERNRGDRDKALPWLRIERDITTKDIVDAVVDLAYLRRIADNLRQDIRFTAAEAHRIAKPIDKALEAIHALAADKEASDA